jgi:hypothetical protein
MSSTQFTLTARLADALGVAVDEVAAIDRQVASLHAARARKVDEARHLSTLAARAATASTEAHAWSTTESARRVLVSELACALRLTENATMMLIEESATLVTDLPATLAALEAGDISVRHANVVADHAVSLPAESRAAFEQKVLPLALTHTVTWFNRHARDQRERMHPESIEQRHEVALSKRSVSIAPGADGMARLTAHLPAESAHAIFDRLTEAAERACREGDPRTLEQLRADALCDGLLVSNYSASEVLGTPNLGTILATIRPSVHVTVPALTLLNRGDEPAILDGYGPIDSDTAALLASNAPTFMRLLTHPETGAVLSVGRDRYEIPAALRRWLQVRDGTCRFPGCGRAARRCELDHTTEWQHGGGTAHNNLAHLCHKHHRLKSLTDWKVEQIGNGTLRWTSPLGKIYLTEPEEIIPATKPSEHRRTTEGDELAA